MDLIHKHIKSNEGSVLFIKLDMESTTVNLDTELEKIGEITEKLREQGTQVIIIDKSMEVEHIPKNYMEELGWIRKEDIERR